MGEYSMSNAILEKHEEISRLAEENNTDEVRIVRHIQVGQAIRQGDLYVTRISDTPETFTQETQDTQLAPGTSKGSRHMVTETPSLKIFKDPNSDALTGPVIESDEDVTITHPEHADFVLPCGTYQVAYQRDYAYEELRAVRD
jgi:hypothetical protein